jgi:hypothetical protein
MFSWNGPGLVPEHFLDLSDLFLCPTFDLFRFSLGFQSIVSSRLAGDFLDGAGDIFGSAFYFVIGA